MDEEGHVKKIYTYSTKTLPLTLKFNDTINIQLQNVNVQGTLTDIQTKTLIRVTKYFICKCLRHSLFLVFRNLLVFFFFFFFFVFLRASLTRWWKALRCLPLSMHSLLDSTLSQPVCEEDCEFTPWGAKLAHVTVLQLSQGQLQRRSHS